MSYLTERQRDVLAFIAHSVGERGVAPTLREISERFGFTSTASAQKHVALLEKKGYLRRQKHQKRGLVVTQPSPGDADHAGSVPLFGVVAAGAPIESLPDSESIDVPTALLRSGEHFALRVRGDSMVDDGIHDGDIVVVQSASTARDGDTVVALVSGEVTLKRLFREIGGTVRLQPSNASLAPLLVPEEHVRVQGVVVGLVRRY